MEPADQGKRREDGPAGRKVPESLEDFPLLEEELGREGEVPWWRPGWRDALKHAGWGRVTVLVLLAGGLVVAVAIVYASMFAAIWLLGLKLVVLALAALVVWAWQLLNRGVRARKGLFCVHCGYSLEGLPDHHRCPECGRPYHFWVVEEYKRDPDWFIMRWKARRRLPPAAEPFAAGEVRRRRGRDGAS